MKQPHVYTLPERFIKDEAVPFRWKLYTIINGFWIAGKPVFASNAFFAEKLGCSERTVREGLLELEKMYLITRHGSSQKRRIIPGGHGEVPESEKVGTPGAVKGGTTGAVGVADGVPHIADSISDSKEAAVAEAPASLEIKEIPIHLEERPKRESKSKYPNARTSHSWFRNPDPVWLVNTTELKCLEIIYDWGEEKARKRIDYAERHINDDGFCIPFVSPYMIANNVQQLAAYAKRNS